MEKDVRRATRELRVVLEPAFPFLGHALVSAGAFTVGLGMTQAAGLALRISCATPILGPALGLTGIGFSSVLAGEASRRFGSHLKGETRRHRSAQAVAQDAALDAIMGITLFKLMGGRFRNLMPSSLLHPGACAVESLPAPGSEYASQMAKGELRRLFKRDGCHHCGRRNGRVIGDHIPPNKLMHGSGGTQKAIQQITASLGFTQPSAKAPLGRLSGKIGQLLMGKSRARLAGPARQRYFPQCNLCSNKQSNAVRMGKDLLVFHFYGMRPWYYAGAFVGLRQYSKPSLARMHQRGLRGGYLDDEQE
ncbi:hypothetical protein COCOBI_06-2610 [Coccomyxa sp. Obi]|nr:hypothetical protein COCOBI_06-2610 [Coccomyxa sp. Obi]